MTAEYEGSDDQFLGRLIAKSSGDPECLDLASAWIDRCSRLHGECCRPQKDVPLPTRLVYIPPSGDQKLQLRTTEGLKGRYAALSYCWGNGSTVRTTKDTFKEREEGFDVAMLPKTLQDAVNIARSLGFEYIWIDALCIIQGDSEDWAHESSRMAEVYGSSSLTLCADLAGSVDEGIFQPRKTLRSHTFGPYGEFCLQTRGTGWPRIVHNPLYGRGWALQERLLSPRILHFLDEQIAWECRTTLYMEEFRGYLSDPDYHFTIRIISHSLNTANVKGELGVNSQLRSWRVAFQELAVRYFTHSSDVFPSLSGFASAIEIPELGKYLAGVWENSPFISMFWFPRWSQDEGSPYIAPSWSWASVEGQTLEFAGAYIDPTTPAIAKDWDLWASRYHPKLLKHHIIHKSADPKGEVLPGSYIVVSGRCRDIFIIDDPNSTSFDEWEFVRDEDPEPGKKVHMDVRNDCESISYFEEDLADIDTALDRRQLKKYICFPIARERTAKWPKTIALLLTEVYGVGKNTYRRVGLFAFEHPQDEDEVAKWDVRSLTLV